MEIYGRIRSYLVGVAGTAKTMASSSSKSEASQRVTRSWSKFWSHGCCKEGLIPSGHRRTASSDSWEVHQRVEINYNKLRELCLHWHPQNETSGQQVSTAKRASHERFMAEYSSIFTRKPLKRDATSAILRRHSCSTPVEISHDIVPYMIAIHGRDPSQQKIADMHTRLKAIHNIVKKLPIQRSSSEVRQLALHLSHFPELTPDPNPPAAVLEGLASRVLEESLPKGGFALPGRGGTYLILQGSVERISKDPVTRSKTSSTMLQAGQSFGEYKNHQYHIRSNDPVFVTNDACALLRITMFDYERVCQNCQTSTFTEKQKLINSCPLLKSMSPSVLSKLAEAIKWETLAEGTTLLQEGQTIERVGFIQQGRCLAYAKVPHVPKPVQVCIGEVGPGCCVGELYLRGHETQPCSIVAASRLRVGWVSGKVVRVNEVEKYILSDKPLAVATLTQEEIRQKYANELTDRHWSKIKHDIMEEVMTERGIRPGLSKWKHANSTDVSSKATKSGSDSVRSNVTKTSQTALSPTI